MFATTGMVHTDLARRTARNLRAAMPGCLIDLFTDQPIDDGIFDRIHRSANQAKRPKMDALRRSRFRDTVYLDADLMVLEDVSDVFQLLDQAPIVGVAGVSKTTRMLTSHDALIPNGFPLINTGFLAIRKSAKMTALLQDWENLWQESDVGLDQPILRALLFNRKIMPLVLPMEYNLIKLELLDVWRPRNGAIRGLHVRKLIDMDHPDLEKPVSLQEVLPFAAIKRLEAARKSDPALNL